MPLARTRLLGAGLAVAALAAPSTAGATGNVHVRVEGAKRTLLPDTVVTTNPHRTIGLGTDPTCSGGSGLGALDAATRGRWGGSYFDSLGYSVESVFGEVHSSANSSYYVVYVNDRPSSQGLCAYTPKARDELLLAPASFSVKGYPDVLRVSAPKTARVNREYNVTVTAVNDAGKARRLGGATLHLGKAAVPMTKQGRLGVTDSKPGLVHIQAAKKGFVRSKTITIRIRKAKQK